MKKYLFFGGICIILCFSLNISLSQECSFPSFEQLSYMNVCCRKSLEEYDLVIGKVIKIKKMPIREQNPLVQMRDHSWYFYRFLALVNIEEIIKVADGIPRPHVNQIIKIAVETTPNWTPGENNSIFRIINLKGAKNIKYLAKDGRYLFCISPEAGYKNIYSLYLPTPPTRAGCNNFFVWPMLIQGDTIEVPVQYYGSDEIVRKKFKYDEIINLYK